MSEPAQQYQPGWYPDPWKQSAQRWHDGNDWTHQMHDAPTAASPTPAAAPQLQPVPGTVIVQQRTSGMAIASLVLAVLGFGLVAVIVGVLALRKIGRSAGELGGRGLAIAGIVVGAVWGLIFLLIVLAVAIPTFLAQKDAVLDTQAVSNLKQIATSVDSCSAATPTGTYEGCTGAELAQKEPALAAIIQKCGSPGGGCAELLADGGYRVTVQNADGSATYAETHSDDGSIERTCEGSGCPEVDAA